MEKTLRCLWLLVGRGGSRGVPGKNLRKIGGASLVAWKMAGVLAADRSARVVVSSDSADIRAEAMDHGASVEIVRPAELASDTATSAEVVRHALGEMRRRGEAEYDAVMLLECSSPFTRSVSYRQALERMERDDADLVVGMKEVTPHPVFIGERRADDSVTGIILGFQRMARRRQDFKQAWTMSGSLYLFRTGMFGATGDLYGGVRNAGLMVGKYDGLEIDTPEDLEIATWAAETGRVRYGD